MFFYKQRQQLPPKNSNGFVISIGSVVYSTYTEIITDDAGFYPA
jgi:hypothetical protein